MIYIKHKSGKYNYVQPARCKHCFCFCPVKSSHPYGFCNGKKKTVFCSSLACGSFHVNDKYITADINQLKLFDHATESIHKVPELREQTSS